MTVRAIKFTFKERHKSQSYMTNKIKLITELRLQETQQIYLQPYMYYLYYSVDYVQIRTHVTYR